MFFEVFLSLCKTRGISPTHAAEQIGISRGTVSNWRANYKAGYNVEPTTQVLQKIAKYFSVTVDYLIGNPLMSENYKSGNTLSFHDNTTGSLAEDQVLTDHELLLIEAYRRLPEVQQTVDEILHIAELKDSLGL